MNCYKTTKTCPICEKELDTMFISTKCGHDICQECFDKLDNLGQIVCPKCGKFNYSNRKYKKN